MTFTGYDGLGRPASKSYDDTITPKVSYSYDSGCTYGKGRLCSVTTLDSATPANELAKTAYSYTSLGEVASRSQTTQSRSYSSSYTYNLAGQLTSMSYRQGTQSAEQVSYGYTQAGRVSNVYKGAVGDTTPRYAKDVGYWAGGIPKTMELGNGVVEANTINGFQQMTGRTAKKSGTLVWGIGLDYGTATANNGNVAWQEVTHGAGATAIRQTYEYDGLNRLKSVVDGGLGTQTFAYDRWGNRAMVTGSYQAPGYMGAVMVASAATDVPSTEFPGNRLKDGAAGTGPTHDAAGKLVRLGSRDLTYDGEGRVTKVAKASGDAEEWRYDYDGEGRRVRQVHVVGTSVADETDYVYDAGGELLAEYAVTGSTIAAEGLRYVTTDWLGSTRLVTDGEGVAVGRHDYLPFGEEVRATGSGLRVKFTGKERGDYANLGLDYFGARYMSAAQGRFTSPDAPFADQDEEAPQSWNLYSYVGNNPLAFVDSDGRGKIRAAKVILQRLQVGVEQILVRHEGGNLGFKAAKDRVTQEGGDIVTKGKSTAKRAAGGDPIHHSAHKRTAGEDALPHFHPTDSAGNKKTPPQFLYEWRQNCGARSGCRRLSFRRQCLRGDG